MNPGEEQGETPTSDPVAALAALTKAGNDPKKAIALVQGLRNDAELAGDLDAAERYTQAIGLLMIGAGEADDPDETAAEETTEEVATESDVAMAAAPMQAAKVQKAGRKIAGSRMKLMKDAVMAYLKVLEEAGDTDATAMLKAVKAQPTESTEMKALTKAMDTMAQAILKINSDVEVIKSQPVAGGPIARFAGQAITKQLGTQRTSQPEPPDPQAVARLRQLVATEHRPELRKQYQDELAKLIG